MLEELATATLITLYECEGDPYYHINGFLRTQPRPRDSRRIRRHPAWAGEDDEAPADERAPQARTSDVPAAPQARTSDVPAAPQARTSDVPPRRYEDEYEDEKEDEKEDEDEYEKEADVSTSPGVSAPRSSDSCSRPRQQARLLYDQALIPLLGRVSKSQRLPADSPQTMADRTVMEQWWDDLWPEEESSADAAGQRVKAFLDLAAKARSRDRPFAWLTQRLKHSLIRRNLT